MLLVFYTPSFFVIEWKLMNKTNVFDILMGGSAVILHNCWEKAYESIYHIAFFLLEVFSNKLCSVVYLTIVLHEHKEYQLANSCQQAAHE
jgi:hypothetical protein